MKFRQKTESLNYVKLKSGDSIQGVFRGDPYEFKQHYIKTENRSYLCEGKDCPYCQEKDEEGKQKHKPAFRFRINFLTLENGQYVAKVFEQSWRTYETLRAMHESDFNLEKTLVKITRYGNDQATTYQINPLPKHEVSPDLEKKLKDVKLNELAHAQSDEEAPF